MLLNDYPEYFCPECGAILDENTEICSVCASDVKGQKEDHARSPGNKMRGTDLILLAVVLVAVATLYGLASFTGLL